MKDLIHLIHTTKSVLKAPGIHSAQELKLLLNAYHGNDWQNYIGMTDNTPKTKILLENEHIKLLIIRWGGFQKTNKHGHPGGGGALKVLSGILLETRFDPIDTDRMIGKYHYFKDAITSIHDTEAYHIVENPVEQPAFSLHLYLKSNEIIAKNAVLTAVPATK